jgi:hypothetical protein
MAGRPWAIQVTLIDHISNEVTDQITLDDNDPEFLTNGFINLNYRHQVKRPAYTWADRADHMIIVTGDNYQPGECLRLMDQVGVTGGREENYDPANPKWDPQRLIGGRLAVDLNKGNWADKVAAITFAAT